MGLTVAERLAEAEAAYHKLMIGGLKVSLSIQGRDIAYDKTNMVQLANYIAALKAEIATGSPPVVRRNRAFTITPL